MARPQSVVDMMHVPSPPVVVDRVRGLLNIPHHCVSLDPCCGTGEALERLCSGGRAGGAGGGGGGAGGKLYGIELEVQRAADAAKKLDAVLACSMQMARVSNDCFGLCLLNPPYDHSTAGRLEEVFLARCTKYLRIGGVLVFIIKQDMYRQCPHMVNILMRNYQVLGHWRFPDPYFNGPVVGDSGLDFGQTVLIAKRTVPKPAHLDDAGKFISETLGLGTSRDPRDLPELPGGGSSATDLSAFGGRQIPVPVGVAPKIFISGMLSEDDLAKLLATSPVSRAMHLPSRLGVGRPPLVLKQGHIALTLASGAINGVYGEGETHHVAKGTVIRQINKGIVKDVTENGNPVLIETITDSFAIRVRALLASGHIHDMTGGPPPQTGEENGEEHAEAA